MTAELVGEKQVADAFRAVANEMNKSLLETRLLGIARGLKNRIKAAAPKGPTGNLKKGVVAKRYKRGSKVKNSPAVYVRIDEKIAPHAHLVERGTKGPRIAGSKAKKTAPGGAWTYYSNGRFYTKSSIGPMPANPFFRRTVDHSKNDVLRDIGKETLDIIQNKWQKELPKKFSY